VAAGVATGVAGIGGGVSDAPTSNHPGQLGGVNPPEPKGHGGRSEPAHIRREREAEEAAVDAGRHINQTGGESWSEISLVNSKPKRR